MKNGEWFDAVYFGHEQAKEHKSNYSRVGGYRPGLANPDGFAQWIRDNIPENNQVPRVLEIGCATGAAVYAMRVLGMRAWGVDVSSYILSQADSNVREFLIWGDMRSIPNHPSIISLGRFAVICSKDVLEHATEDTIEDILRDFSRICGIQMHIVNTGERRDQAAAGDQSHFLVRPLAWWDDLAQTLDLPILFQAT